MIDILMLVAGLYAVVIVLGKQSEFCRWILNTILENRLSEFLLPLIMRITLRYTRHSRHKMSEKEMDVYYEYLSELIDSFGGDWKSSNKPFIVALIGLVGSGKTFTATIMAREMNAVHINYDRIRIHLRKVGERYEGARKVAESLTDHFTDQGISVVLDSDHGDQLKRAIIRSLSKELNAPLYFVRTHSNFDVAIGRIIDADYQNSFEDFFGGATSQYAGDDRTKGAIIKTRELWRRTPHHYQWRNEGGGKWVLKQFPFELAGFIDTSRSDWREKMTDLCFEIQLNK